MYPNNNESDLDLEKDETEVEHNQFFEFSNAAEVNTKVVEESDMIECPNCGAKMNKNARCCIKCGEINEENPQNEMMKKYIKKNRKYKINKDKVKEVKQEKVDGNGRTRKEKIYTFIRNTIIIILLSMTLAFVLNRETILNKIEEYRRNWYVNEVIEIVEMVKLDYTNKSCTGDTYYFYNTEDTLKTGISLYTFTGYEGYVRVIDNNGSITYLVSVTDGKKGFINVDSKDLDEVVLKDVEEITSNNTPMVCQ